MSLRSEVIRIYNELISGAKKISELPAAGTLTGTELVEGVQGGANVKMTTQDIADLGGGGGVSAASEILAGKAELATQAETNTGSDDERIVTPLKLKVKNRLNTSITASANIAQTDDQSTIFVDGAAAVVLTFPVLVANTYLTVVNIGDFDITWSADGTTFDGPVISLPGGTVGAVTFFYKSTTDIKVLGGSYDSLSSLVVAGAVNIKAGASSGTIAKVGGVIKTDTTQAGNVGTGEDTLFTYSLPAAVLNTNKESITGFVCGTFAANANNKNVRLKFGATTLLATGALAFNAGDWRIDFTIVRTGAATQKAIAVFTSSNTTLSTTTDYTTPAETLSGAVTILVTGEATSNNDIVGEMLKIRWEAAE